MKMPSLDQPTVFQVDEVEWLESISGSGPYAGRDGTPVQSDGALQFW